jgi:hypothetical protein
MGCHPISEKRRFRVWIVMYEGTTPAHWQEIPPKAIAMEPAEIGTMSARQASQYVETFNRTASTNPHKYWAVALPVTIRYEGDPQPGSPVASGTLAT